MIMEFVHKLVYAETLEDLTRILSDELKDPSSIIVKYSNVLKRRKRCKIKKNSGQLLIALCCVCKVRTLTIIQKPVLEF